jgi:hypothetical protein
VLANGIPARNGSGMDFPPGPFRVEVAGLREADLLVAERLLVNVLLDVFVAADVNVDREVRAAAIALTLPTRLLRGGAIVTQVAAAWLWCGGPAPPYVDVVQRPGQGRASRPGVVLHERRIDPADVTGAGELLVTAPARTAADLMRMSHPERASRALHELMAHTGLTLQEVAETLERMPRMRGVARARDLLGRWPDTAAAEPADRQSIRLPVTR